MRVVTLICVLFALGDCAPSNIKLPTSPRLDGRIVGGRPVEIYDHPYQAALLYFGSHICGAVNISPKFLITAAHCVDGGTALQFSVRVGSSFEDQGGQVIQVERIVVHPDFDYLILDNDIAVLFLASELHQSSAVDFIEMVPHSTPIPTGIEAVVTGWGALTEGGSFPYQLQAVGVNIISLEACRIAYGLTEVTETMICAGVEGGGKDACQGDSGGPLTVNKQVVGLVSWGYGCARPDFPGVYTSVAALHNWVTSVTGT